MDLIVAKFGGSSVSTKEKRAKAIEQIKKINEKTPVVVVVSAMGRKGEPYATDTLLSLVSENVNLKTRDLLMSCGESISAAVFASELEEAGLASVAMNALDAGIMAEGDFGEANITGVDTANILEALQWNYIPVVTGFQAVTQRGDTVTLGRGGSDTSAVVLACFLEASEVHIFTDVPGIADKDPSVYADAKFYDELSYEKALELAENGAKVIHPRAVQYAMDFHMPLRVRSTFEDGEGTLLK